MCYVNLTKKALSIYYTTEIKVRLAPKYYEDVLSLIRDENIASMTFSNPELAKDYC